MKKLLSLFLLGTLFTGCSTADKLEVYIQNSTGLQRTDEMIEIKLSEISPKLGLKNGEKLIVLNDSSKQIAYQIATDLKSEKDSLLIFQVTVPPQRKVIYTVKKGEPEKFKAKTFGRYVPERKDDFAWENDRIAFRMYGPKLAAENGSNGVDVWLKKTNSLIVNKFYYNDLVKHQPYHIDYGQGLDCYKVAHTLGAGGIAPYTDTTLWVANQYDHWKIIENGPLRTTFQLSYDSVKVKNSWLKEKLTISIDAGAQLNKGVVSYSGNIPDSMKLAVGLYLHDGKGIQDSNIKIGFIGYGEVATSDLGVPAGRDYVGAVIPNNAMQVAKLQDDHLLAICNYTGKDFTYYFGAGWNQWGFPNDKAWLDYLVNFSEKVKNPLKVTIK